jgi:drug/metabolite transporter (DMT)-like permease
MTSTPTSTPAERKLALAAWLAVCLIWGTTYMAIRVALESMPPLVMMGLRWTLAGGVLSLFLAARGERVFSRALWPRALRLGFLMLLLGNAGVAIAELWVPSGLTAVLVASTPFWMTGVEALRPDGERITRTAALGFVLGFSGIVLLVWPELAGGGAVGRGFLFGVISLQVAAFGWAVGSSYSKRHPPGENVLSATALQMLAGGVMMLALGTLHGEWGTFSFGVRSTLAFAYLTSIGSLGGFVAYTYALRHLPVSLVSLYAYINPIIAVALGVAVLGEPFTIRTAFAAALVFGGVAVVRAQVQTRLPLTNRTRNSTMAITSST